MRGGRVVEWFLDAVVTLCASSVVVLYGSVLAVLVIGP
jgi:hypothetical protein